MDGFVLKLVMDGSFYLAVFMPVIAAVPKAAGAGLLAVLALWFVWLFFNWKRRNLIEMVRDHFFMEVRLLILFEIFESLFLGLAQWKRQCAPFLVTFLISGILLLRVGRVSKGNQEKLLFWGANGAEMAGVVAAALLLTWEPVSGRLLRLPALFYNTLVLPVLTLILNGAVAFLTWLWPYIEGFFPELSARQQTEPLIMAGGSTGLMELESLEAAETPAYFKLLGLLAVLAVLFLFFRYLYRRLSERGSMAGAQNKGEISRSAIGKTAKRTAGRFSFSGERNVRYYYRRFLELCRDWGIAVSGDAVTSERIRAQAQGLWGMEAELSELRRLYLEIRYGGKKESREERQRVRALYKAIKEKAEETET